MRLAWLSQGRLEPAAAHRGVSRSVFQKYAGSLTPDLRIMDLLDNQPEFTKSLTPDLRIMDLMDNQPEFTKSFWDYLDVLVTDVGADPRVRALLVDAGVEVHTAAVETAS